MVEYSKIIKDAYLITKQNLILWFFGLFLLGGFNLGFLRFVELPSELTTKPQSVMSVFEYFQHHPGNLAIASASILLVAGMAIIVTNWSKVMLVLVGRSLLEGKPKPLSEQFEECGKVLWPVIRVSLVTSAAFLVVAAVAFAPYFILKDYINTGRVMLVLGSLIFLPLAFTFSALNIFASLFIILYKVPLYKAFTQATDLFIMEWPQLLALGVILMIVYSLSFVVGVGLIGAIRLLLSLILDYLGEFKFFPVSAIILIIRFVTVLMFWVVMAGINVFFNMAVLRLFLEIIKPKKAEPLKNPVNASAMV
jgi:hypothetical protein